MHAAMDHRIETQVMTIPNISPSRTGPVFFMDVDEIGYDKIGAVKVMCTFEVDVDWHKTQQQIHTIT
jgi:hypothetical protein